MEKCKIANILEMTSRRAKLSEIWNAGVVLGSICCYGRMVYINRLPLHNFG